MVLPLIDLGARPDVIYRQLYEQFSLGRIRLAGIVLGRVTLDCDGRLGYTWVEAKDFDESGARPVDTEDLVNECLKISGTQCAFIAVEQLNKTVKISFRSRTGIDVASVAEKFGGGGHKQAAGATLTGSLKDATQRALTAMVPLWNPRSQNPPEISRFRPFKILPTPTPPVRFQIRIIESLSLLSIEANGGWAR